MIKHSRAVHAPCLQAAGHFWDSTWISDCCLPFEGPNHLPPDHCLIFILFIFIFFLSLTSNIYLFISLKGIRWIASHKTI